MPVDPDVDNSPPAAPGPTPAVVLDWSQRDDVMDRVWPEFSKALLRFFVTVYYPRMVAKRNERSKTPNRSESQDAGSSTAGGRGASSRPNKRRKMSPNRPGRGSGDDERDGEDGRQPAKEPLPGDRSDTGDHLPLACPFQKWRPGLFSTGCSGRYGNINRVKDHLKNHHLQPYCPDCYGVLENENGTPQVDSHPRPCRRKPQEALVITKEKWMELKSMRFPMAIAQGDRWQMVYKVLFPQEEYIPNPYFDSVCGIIMDHLDWTCQNAAPGILQGVVSELVSGGLLPLDEAGFTNIIRRGIYPLINHVMQQNGLRIYSGMGPLPAPEDRPSFRQQMWVESLVRPGIRPGK
jgi:hypothetical protein